MTLDSGVKRVKAIGLAESLSAVSMPVNRLHVEAIYDNTSLVYIGGKGTHAGQRNGASLKGDPDGQRPAGFTFDNIDLADVWIDSLVAAEGVSWMVEIA